MPRPASAFAAGQKGRLPSKWVNAMLSAPPPRRSVQHPSEVEIIPDRCTIDGRAQPVTSQPQKGRGHQDRILEQAVHGAHAADLL